MKNFMTKCAVLLTGFAGVANAMQGNGLCCGSFTIGADWLYWTPCISDHHFAIYTDTSDTESATTNIKTKYFCDDWDSGFRVYGKVEELLCDYNGCLVYTHIKPSAKGHVEAENTSYFSNALPLGNIGLGDRLDADWEMEYQNLDATLSYSIDVCRNPCLDIEAFSGLTWVDVKQHSKQVLTNDVGTENEEANTFKRDLDFWAVGPTFGIKTSLNICDCFNIFGTMQTSLVVGESKSKDYIDHVGGSVSDTSAKWHAKDECFCFPGLHLLTGISYDACLCDCAFGIRVGWEYVQWINAPAFPYYEQGEEGVRSAPSAKNLTMQGIFVGAHASF